MDQIHKEGKIDSMFCKEYESNKMLKSNATNYWIE
jgi:hypothetical protein